MSIPNRVRLTLIALLAGAAPAAAPERASADPLDVIVSLDTSMLVSNPAAGLFSLDFQLNQGFPETVSNTAILSAFDFGGGSPQGTPSLIGGASGNLATSVVINDTNPFNVFTQGFTPGSSLSFRLQLTENVEPTGFGDLFTFSILDRTGSELPTQSFFDVFVEIPLDAPGPVILTFASDPTVPPVAGGDPLNIPAPTVTVVPEPASLAMAAAGLAGAATLGLRRRRPARAA